MAETSLCSALRFRVKKKKWNQLSLQQNLIRCHDKKLYVDLDVHVQDKIFQAHKNILSFYSPVFQKVCYGTKVPPSACRLNEIKPQGFAILLRFLYSSQIPTETEADDLVEAWHAAQTLEMVGIGEKLMNYILCKTSPGEKNSAKNISEKQFWTFMKKFRSLALGNLQRALLEFAESHFTSILDSEAFKEADSETIKLVLGMKPPGVPEVYVLERIASWKESNVNLESLDQHVLDLLDCVNFKRLSPKEFYVVVRSKHDGLMPERDSLDILMHLVDPTVCPLPEWYHFDDKWWNISANQEARSKSESVEDIWTANNLSSSARDWGKWKRAFKSQEDLKKVGNVENYQEWTGKKCKSKAKGYGKSLQESFYQMLQEGLFTDVTLIAKEGTEIPAHRLVLALGSCYFADAFYKASPTQNTLRMDETADEVKVMLRYFYGCFKSVPGSSLESILRKADIALKYMCYPLMQVCKNAFSRISLNPDNFWTLAGLVNQQIHCKVKPKVLEEYAVTSTKRLFQHDSFLGASKDSLIRILKMDDFNVEEIDILEHVARWLEENIKQFPTDSSRIELLKNIRFEALGAEQFFAFLQKHEGLLPIQDSFTILKFLFKRGEGNRLPQWCYSGPLRSVFYHHSYKIGTKVPLPWSGKLDKGKNCYTFNYTITISGNSPKSDVQFLELALRSKQSTAELCSVTIKTEDGSKPLLFQGLRPSRKARYLLPVSFHLDAAVKPKICFDLILAAKPSHELHWVVDRTLKFQNVTFMSTPASQTTLLCDAIVDGFTSQNIPIPQHLLSKIHSLQWRHIAVETEKFFKVATEV